MLTIRLQRTGTKNKPSFRLVLAESYRSASKQALEVLGHYNPGSKNLGIKDQERLNYWLGQHVHVSPTVNNLLIEKKIITGEKVKAWKPKKKEATAEATTPAPAAEAKTEAAAPTESAAEPAPETPAS